MSHDFSVQDKTREATCVDVNTDEPQPQASNQENEEKFGGPIFHPPLYRQRYSAVISVLEKHAVSTVADVGCAECKLLSLLRESRTIKQIYGLDIDRILLTSNSFKIQPRSMDFLKPRDATLHNYLLCGSMVDYDTRLAKLDAITMIEVVEHLEKDVLAAFPDNVFGRLQPRLVVMTTPNVEFNVLFPNCTGFRHYDHKFEWTREEFKQWCEEQCARYPYQVELSGVGDPPQDSTHLGHCSQMAVFTRIGDYKTVKVLNYEEKPYELIAESVFKGKPRLSREEETLQEAQYYINMLLYMKLRRDRYGDCDYDTNDSQTNSGNSDDSQTYSDNPCESQTYMGNPGESQTYMGNPDIPEGVRQPIESSHRSTHSDTHSATVHTESLTQGSSELGTTRMKEKCDSQVPVYLSELLKFPKMSSLCGDVNYLREVLQHAGYAMSEDGRYVLCDKYPDSSDSESDRASYDNGYVVMEQAAEEEHWSTDEDAECYTAPAMLQATHSQYVCQMCYKLMDRVNLHTRKSPSSANETLCTYCYKDHCLNCHIAKYKDTKTYEENCGEWTPLYSSPRTSAIHRWRGTKSWFEKNIPMMPSSANNYTFNFEEYEEKCREQSELKLLSVDYEDMTSYEMEYENWIPKQSHYNHSAIKYRST